MGPLASQMAIHIILMNAVAPCIALILRRAWRPGDAFETGLDTGRLLFSMTLLQLLLLWAWHAPKAMDLAMTFHGIHLLMQLSLLLTASVFWWAVLEASGDRRWQPILALLVTSKLFCLLGVLFVFSPRAIYGGHGHGSATSVLMADQQLAGLLMLVACPATYVIGGILVARRWLIDMENTEAAHDTRETATGAGH